MATIKQILQDFCYRVNLTTPTAFVGVDSPAERQYMALFKYIGDNLRNRPYQWPQLRRGYTFTVTSGTTTYQLPGDFYRLLESSQWDTTNHWPMKGPISEYQLNLRQYAVVSLTTRKAFKVIGPVEYKNSSGNTSRGMFQIDPAPDNSTDVLFMGYLSNNWVWPQAWVAGTTYSAGDIRSGDGYIYQTAAGGVAGATRPSVATGSVSDGTVTWTVYLQGYSAGPANTKLNDSDVCLFDDDLMIEGIRWAYKKAKGQDYQQERQDWEDMVKSAYARFEGPTRISMIEQDSYEWLWPFTAEGSWDV